MKIYLNLLLTLAMGVTSSRIVAQDSSHIFFTTGTGLIKSPGSLHHVFHPSLAFNSGIELTNKKDWFLQGSVDFNSLQYNQHIKDNTSPYLFQNTSSSLLMLAASAGRNFHFGKYRWLVSVYTGAGFLNIGEPRVVMIDENIIKQETSRKNGAFAKIGTRIGYRTKSKFLQTIYIDGAWWKSPLQIQGAGLSGVSLFAGIRMALQ